MQKTMLNLLAYGLTLVSASGAVAQGLYWENESTGFGDKTRSAKIYAMPKMMKIVQDSGGVIIIRGDQDKFYSIDPARKTYTEFTLPELEASAKTMQGQMKAAMEKMQRQMKDMAPEQRAMAEKMVKDMGGAAGEKAPVVEVKSTGETKTIGGYACSQYVATANGKTILTAWTTKDVKGFASLRDDWLAYQKRMLAANRGPGGEIAAAYAKIEGFPMETVMGDIKTVVTKVEPRTTPASDFDVPAGYEKQTLNAAKPGS